MNKLHGVMELDFSRFKIRLVEIDQSTIQNIYSCKQMEISMKEYRKENNQIVVQGGDSEERELVHLSGNWSEDSVTIGKSILDDFFQGNSIQIDKYLEEFINSTVFSMNHEGSSIVSEDNIRSVIQKVDIRDSLLR